ncbi:JHE-like toxin [Sodalis praecaptivus]|uniref:JHE-like toxin n=1 Tax=Sodalis praecaptivus TaxID=1239307 RepID=W0HUH7_9GAMM|nr:hypothetical protein [Sodalis praecaptivus]AHF77486.1 JHE-like toxin [Sodalis praecaptivus]
MTISITVSVSHNDVEFDGGKLDRLRHGAAIAADDHTARVTEGEMRIEPRSSLQATRTDTPIIPESRGRFYVANAGKAKQVTAVFYWSHSFTSEWFEYSSTVIARGTDGIVMPPSNSLYYSKIVIYNDTDDVAFVTAYTL